MITNRGCQTQEKVVAASTKTFIVIADYRYNFMVNTFSDHFLAIVSCSKKSTSLGEKVSWLISACSFVPHYLCMTVWCAVDERPPH